MLEITYSGPADAPCPAARYLRGELDDTARGSDGFGSSGVE